MMAALEGGLTFQKGLGAVHALSHPLGGLKAPSLHHGTLNAVLLPAVLRFNEPHAGDKYGVLRRVLQLPEDASLPDYFAALSRPPRPADEPAPDGRARGLPRRTSRATPRSTTRPRPIRGRPAKPSSWPCSTKRWADGHGPAASSGRPWVSSAIRLTATAATSSRAANRPIASAKSAPMTSAMADGASRPPQPGHGPGHPHAGRAQGGRVELGRVGVEPAPGAQQREAHQQQRRAPPRPASSAPRTAGSPRHWRRGSRSACAGGRWSRRRGAASA